MFEIVALSISIQLTVCPNASLDSSMDLNIAIELMIGIKNVSKDETTYNIS